MISLASLGRAAGIGLATIALVRVTWVLRALGPFPIARLVRRELQPSIGSRAVVPLALVAGTLMVVAPTAWTVLRGHAAFAIQPTWNDATLAAIVGTIILKLAFVVFEELAFRAALIQVLESRLGTIVAIGVSAAAFGLAHGRDATSTAILVVDGVGFGTAYVATRSLRAPIAWHAAKNLAVWVLLGAGTVELVHGPLRLTPTDVSVDTAPSPALTLVIAMMVVLAMTLWLRARPVTPADAVGPVVANRAVVDRASWHLQRSLHEHDGRMGG